VSATARAVALIVAALALLGALAMSVGPGGGGFPLLVVALLILVGVVFERRYGGRDDELHDHLVDWQPTGERFVDPESDAVLEVWTDPLTGERRYEPLETADPRRRLPERR
jgi:hypothetical protein